ncbi:MAG: hypothetical protein FWF12_02605 [Betaproteobacteria bacterium]|nr:hypothetical protein [Betaproteobacteria bacterium]
MKLFIRLSLCLLLCDPVSAQTNSAPPAPEDPASVSSHTSPAYVAQARKTIDTVLAEPEFDQTRITKIRRLKQSSTNKKVPSNYSQNKFLDWGQLFAQSGQIALWLLAFGLIVLLLAYSKRWLPLLGLQRFRDKPLAPVRQSDSTLEIAVALPEDIAAAAERCWKEGKKDEALSLLYRGAIELLAARYCINLTQGATEEEIRLLVGNAMPSFKDDFGIIVRAWLRLAYAHRPPTDITALLAGFSRIQQAEGTVS